MGKPEGRVNASERVNAALSGSARIDNTHGLPLGEIRGLTKLVKITDDVRRYAAEKGLSKEEAFTHGPGEKPEEFIASSVELWAKI